MLTNLDFFIKPSKFFIGDAKRRRKLGLPLRDKANELSLPVIDKENIPRNRYLFYRIQAIQLVFYSLVIEAFGWALYNLENVIN